MARLKQLIHEVHRRSLWQVLLIYVAGGWAVLAVVDTLAGALNLPEWAPSLALFLLIVGLPIVLATAFVQEGVGRRAGGAEEVETTSGGTPVPSAGGGETAGRRILTWRNAIGGGVIAFALLFGFAGLYVVIQDRGQSFAPDEAIAEEADPGIAFMPFTVSGADLEHLREGMVTLLFNSLDGAAGLRAISDRTVLAQWDKLVGTDQRADLETAMSVAAATGARYTLLGSVVAVGGRLQLSGDIHELPDGTSLGRVQVQGNADSVLVLAEELAVETLRTLAQAGVETVPLADLRGVTTQSLPALTAYLEGEAYFRRGDFEASIPYFEAALEADGSFALAHYRIAGAIGWRWGGAVVLRNKHLDAALAANLPPRKKLLARASRHESLELLKELEEFVRHHPDDAEAWYELGDLVAHRGPGVIHDWPERTKRSLQRAAELDPGFAPYMIHLIDFAFVDNDADEAAHWVARYGNASPGSASDRTHRIGYRLVFEPPADLSAFEAAIDSLAEAGSFNRLRAVLGQPRASDIGIAVHLRSAEQTGELHSDICWLYALAEGRWRDFVSYASDPRMAPDRHLVCLFHAYIRDYPVPEELLEEAARSGTEGGSCPECWAGGYAASQGRWEEYERWLAALREKPEAAPLVSLLEGYGQWKAGNPEQARATLESAPDWPPVQWWLGQINLELGKPEVAVEYFSSFFGTGLSATPWTRSLYYLGLAYEQMGELEKAQEAYAEYLDIWKDADAELEPLKEQARVRLEAILAERG